MQTVVFRPNILSGEHSLKQILEGVKAEGGIHKTSYLLGGRCSRTTLSHREPLFVDAYAYKDLCVCVCIPD